jgi:tetrapyrrole methylase family protein/MazG family protein
MRDEAAQALRELNEVVERLRAPGGCPWDREQTHRSLRPYLLEETYELLEAIDSRGPGTLREELGDLLLQVLMHSAIAAEGPEGFDIGDVAETTRAKMVHRHPHVFGDVSVRDAADVVVNWERLKRAEKRERISLLEGVPHALPALAFAQGLQKRPARVGFDETPSVADALVKVREALHAVTALAGSAPPRAARGADWTVSEGEIARRSVPGGGDAGAVDGGGVSAADSAAGHAPPPPLATPALEAAIGDLLFATVALSRHLRVNPEDALRRRATDFADRFRQLESVAHAEGVDLHDLSPGEWSRRWAESQAPLAPGPPPGQSSGA